MGKLLLNVMNDYLAPSQLVEVTRAYYPGLPYAVESGVYWPLKTITLSSEIIPGQKVDTNCLVCTRVRGSNERIHIEYKTFKDIRQN